MSENLAAVLGMEVEVGLNEGDRGGGKGSYVVQKY